mmetsp:Transcript_12344/g.19139  ORF Transcript_12344/g.19139 Transcript_12344/m.19139 type:complete len:310 (+) Transcript_12344:70-999(+)|eukprot:CAMPEP_0195283126 /NCGR_PEP_ID=MMETSP0707-20130614/1772_1 /TAXON_ID=33640 /ORGANISM="Asterionellopsis glacialis, Strain CCMP134" /LENGTH=309 /DNA_ID=CAMNT_0040342241 /DNA_START=63 /DNA_END=992 /DNA_ORIENTATION=+
MVNVGLTASSAFLLVASCLMLSKDATRDIHRSLRQDVGKEQMKTLIEAAKKKLVKPAPDILGVVINSPKCGTAGLTQSFVNSFDPCLLKNITSEEVQYFECAEGRGVIRSHDLERGTEAIKEIRRDAALQQCLVVTAIRHPEHWLPSLFLQCREGNALCHADVSREEYFQRYHDWLMFEREMNKARNTVRAVRPILLKAFGATSLESEMIKVQENGGYSLLEDPEPEGGFKNCKLLFLRMEDEERWHSILADVMPGIRYFKASSRLDKCPKTADHYKALQDYKLSEEEKASVLGDDPDMREYFRAYGLL